MSVAILLYDGVSAYEALGAYAALRAAHVDAELVGPEALVPAKEGARLVPHRLGHQALESAEAVVLPGGDVTKALADPGLARALRTRRGKWVLASGEAVRLVAAAGLAEGRRLARMPGEAALHERTQGARLVADGRLLTSFPGDPLVDLVLHYVSRAVGPAEAQRAAHALGRKHRPFAFGAEEG